MLAASLTPLGKSGWNTGCSKGAFFKFYQALLKAPDTI